MTAVRMMILRRAECKVEKLLKEFQPWLIRKALNRTIKRLNIKPTRLSRDKRMAIVLSRS